MGWDELRIWVASCFCSIYRYSRRDINGANEADIEKKTVVEECIARQVMKTGNEKMMYGHESCIAGMMI
jgi:hypothetical protein